MNISYRPEIDGLRAIAVLAVIIYHAEFVVFGKPLFEGGFIGVDIFFVISGYLISKIILRELMDTGSFSFLHFYDRRIRRILPVLIVVILVSMPFAWELLVPSAFVEYAKSIISSLLFSSNIYFLITTTQYGAESSLLKPFLHTWSLSVEEQFYLIFPIIFLFIYKYFRRFMFAVIIIGLLASLQFAEVMSTRDPDFNFYLLPTRGWELLAGTLLAMLDAKYRREHHKILHLILPTIGLVLILHSVFYLDENVRHPSYFTVLPILGISFIIYFSRQGEPVGTLLASRPFVGVGLISYSLYLWHFPVFAFARIGSLDPGQTDKIIWIAITFALSIASYYAIEKPFRGKSVIPAKVAFPVIAVATSAAFVANAMVVRDQGDFARFDDLRATLQNYEIDNQKLQRLSWSLLGNKAKAAGLSTRDSEHTARWFSEEPETVKVLIAGNSHSKDFYNAFQQNRENFPSHEFARYGVELNVFQCDDRAAEEFYSSPNYKAADVVLVSTFWRRDRHCANVHSAPIVSDLKSVEVLSKRVVADGKKLVITSNMQGFEAGKNTVFDNYFLHEVDRSVPLDIDTFASTIRREYFEKRDLDPSKINVELRERAASVGAPFLDKEELVCDIADNICHGITPNAEKSFYDKNHFTLEGAKFFGKRMALLGWQTKLQ
ncbi:MAG: acyltransferase family protein [Stappiaceae bacterium]